jgi:hypothetical protein
MAGCIKYNNEPGNNTEVVGRRYEVPKRIYALQKHKFTFNPLTPELNPSAQRCLTRFLLGILLLEPCISLMYA